jgi:hypothetical protein
VLAAPGLSLVGTGVAVAAPGLAGTKTAKPGVVQAAWYWQTALRQADPPVDPNEVPVTEPSGVPDGDFAVANTASDGSSSKLSVLAFDIGSLEPGTTVDEFTLTLTLDGSPDATSINTAAAAPVACLPTRAWPTGDPGPMADAPAVNCTAKVAPKVDGSTYTFQLADLAQSWVDDQNLGVAIVNDPANTTTPFQLVFTGVKTVKATIKFTPPVKTTPSDSTGGDTGTTGGTTGGSTTGGTTSGGVGGGTTTPPPPVTVDVPASGPTTETVDPAQGRHPRSRATPPAPRSRPSPPPIPRPPRRARRSGSPGRRSRSFSCRPPWCSPTSVFPFRLRRRPGSAASCVTANDSSTQRPTRPPRPSPRARSDHSTCPHGVPDELIP